MAMRRMANQPFAFGRATSKPRHVRFGRRLVDKDKPRRIEGSLPPFPLAPGLGNVRQVLLGRMESLFL